MECDLILMKNEGKLPSKLGVDLLISARFELRFTDKSMLGEMIQGFLFFKNKKLPKINYFPENDIPQAIRDSDLKLQFAYTRSIDFGEHYEILIGDRVVAISSKLPYKGWDDFKKQITKLIELGNKYELLKKVQGCSITYVDLIDNEYYQKVSEALSLSVQLKEDHYTDNELMLRLIKKDEKFVNIIQILSQAEATNKDVRRKGIVVDITTHRPSNCVEQLEKETSIFLDGIHQECKEMFFKCLTDKLVKKLIPTYDN